MPLQVGMVGLGRMGGNMTARLIGAGHEVVGFALEEEAVASARAMGATGANDLEDLTRRLIPPRVVWLMIPAGDPVTATIDELVPLLAAGDVVVDGGNSRYTESMKTSRKLAGGGIDFADVGVSGGIWGRDEGFCLMVGADAGVFERLRPIFEALSIKDGFAHVGPVGAGHYTKMVHNGIEYGLMQAYAEGFELLKGGPFDLDTGQIAKLWQHGSVVRSWLLDLAARAFEKDPNLEDVAPYVQDSGEGRWTIETAIEHAVPTPVIAAALFARFVSRQDDPFAMKVLAALRREFGGHETRPPET